MSETSLDEADTQSELDLPDGAQAVSAHVTGTVWKLLVKEGQRVVAGKPVVVVESMKMEFAVEAPINGTLSAIILQGRRPRFGGADAIRDPGRVIMDELLPVWLTTFAPCCNAMQAATLTPSRVVEAVHAANRA